MAQDRKVGVRELAALAKVSVGTVDRALNGRPEISETTRRRILELARKHGYRPNLAARALSAARSKVRIGVCLPRHFPAFYDQIREGILDEAARFQHAGVEIVYRPTGHLGIGEPNVVKAVLKSRIRALILTPGDPAALAPVIDQAESKADVRVVCVASDDSLSRRSSWIAVDPTLNGKMAAELMAHFLPAGSSAAIVTGFLKTEDHARKVDGFSQVFPRECPGGGIAGVIEGHDYDQETFEKTRDFLRAHRRLDGIYVSTAIMIPVCRALESEGRAGRVKVIATDLFEEAVPHVLNGTISAIIYQCPYNQGQLAVRFLMDHFMNGAALPRSHAIAPSIVLKCNLSTFREVRGSPAIAASARPQ